VSLPGGTPIVVYNLKSLPPPRGLSRPKAVLFRAVKPRVDDMTDMFQVVTHWGGFPGAPGFTNMFFEHSDPPSTGAQNAVDNVRAFWNTNKGLLPSVVQLQVDPLVKIINAETGDLTDIITVATSPATVSGTAADAYPAPAGAIVNWSTTTIHATRRVRGRTFIVPCADVVFGPGGSLVDTFVAPINAAATALRTATGPTFGIWARPVKAEPLATPPVAGRAGAFAPATGNSVPDKTCILRSRRD